MYSSFNFYAPYTVQENFDLVVNSLLEQSCTIPEYQNIMVNSWLQASIFYCRMKIHNYVLVQDHSIKHQS